MRTQMHVQTRKPTDTEEFVGELREDNATSGKRVLRESVTRASDVAALRSRCLAKVLSHGGEEWAPDDATGDEGAERQALSRVKAKVVTDVIHEFGDVCSLSRVHLSRSVVDIQDSLSKRVTHT